MIRFLVATVIAGFATSAFAADVLTTHRLSAALANEAVGAAGRVLRQAGLFRDRRPFDSDGVRQADLRGDGAGIHTLDSANDKAYTSLTFKADTGALTPRAQAIGPLTSRLPHLLLFQGGLVIKIGDEVVGAIGASGAPGGPLDEACARAGIDAIRGRLK